MTDDSDTGEENEDWLAGAEIGISAADLTFFDGQCIEIDTSRLPDPPDEPGIV